MLLAISCEGKRKRFPAKRILFIGTPQNVCSVLCHAGKDLSLPFSVVVQRLTLVNVTVKRWLLGVLFTVLSISVALATSLSANVKWLYCVLSGFRPLVCYCN